jgi:hypothetical protein
MALVIHALFVCFFSVNLLSKIISKHLKELMKINYQFQKLQLGLK